MVMKLAVNQYYVRSNRTRGATIIGRLKVRLPDSKSGGDTAIERLSGNHIGLFEHLSLTE